jgi:hypothetical protein
MQFNDEAWQKISEEFQRISDAQKETSEEYWNSLSKEHQLMVFCAIARRIYQGELVDRGTYRWVLYDVFGFGPEAYAPAQIAGYLDIHNSIMGWDEEKEQMQRFAEFVGVDKSKVNEFYGIKEIKNES